jgi:hypothetical protein
MQSGANHAPGDTPDNREKFREFAHFGSALSRKTGANVASTKHIPWSGRRDNREITGNPI